MMRLYKHLGRRRSFGHGPIRSRRVRAPPPGLWEPPSESEKLWREMLVKATRPKP